MSEKGGERVQAEDVRMASVDQSDTVDLSSGKKDAGYPPGSIPGAEEHNWLFWKRYLQTLNLYAQVPRIFGTLGEALDQIGVSPPDVPIVVAERFAVDGLLGGGSTVFKLGDPATFDILGNPIIDLACDGQKIYAAVGSFVAGRRSFGSLTPPQWSVNPGSPQILSALESDGLNVYAAYLASHDIYLLDPVDGSTRAVIADATTTISDVAANGEHLLVAERAFFSAVVYDTLGGTPAFISSTPSHGANVDAVALDHDQGYLTGEISSGVAVRAFALTSPGSWLWSTTLPGITGGTDIKADGAFVYVVTDQGDGNVSAWCLCRANGCVIWGGVVDQGQDLKRCAVDHRHLWVTDTSDVVYALDKSSGVEVFRLADRIVHCADGHQAFTSDLGGGGTFRGLRSGEHRVFTVVAGTDPDRHPFPRIAIPEAEPPLGAQAQINVFGDEYQGAEETTADSNATATPSQFLRLTTPAGLPAGTYEIGWYYVWQHSNLTTSFVARVQIDDTTDLIDPSGTGIHREEPKDVATTQRLVSSGFATVALGAGAHDIDIDFWIAPATGTGTMHHARLRLMRVS